MSNLSSLCQPTRRFPLLSKLIEIVKSLLALAFVGCISVMVFAGAYWLSLFQDVIRLGRKKRDEFARFLNRRFGINMFDFARYALDYVRPVTELIHGIQLQLRYAVHHLFSRPSFLEFLYSAIAVSVVFTIVCTRFVYLSALNVIQIVQTAYETGWTGVRSGLSPKKTRTSSQAGSVADQSHFSDAHDNAESNRKKHRHGKRNTKNRYDVSSLPLRGPHGSKRSQSKVSRHFEEFEESPYKSSRLSSEHFETAKI